MGKLILVIFLVFICWVSSSAQHFIHVLYLRNGSIIHGRVMVNTADSLKMQTLCGDIIAYNPADVIKIDSEKNNRSKTNSKDSLILSGKGFFSQSTLGLIIGNSDVMNDPGFSFQTTIGYEFSNIVGIGVGSGIEKYNFEVIPVFLRFKSELLKRENTPLVNLHFGYSFPMNKKKTINSFDYNYEGGLCAGLDIGICSYKIKSRAFTFSFGYQYQHLIEKSKANYWGLPSAVETNTYDFNKVVVKIGFLFK